MTSLVRLPNPSNDLAGDIRRVRAEAVARVTEVDLLVAALKDHVRDLQRERDWLRSEIDRLHATKALAEATWLARGQKPNR